MWFNVLILLICIGFTLRNLVILAGWWKEPVLKQFRKYGDEPRYYPQAHLILWFVTTVLVFTAILFPRRTPVTLLLIGMLLLFVVMWIRNYPETSQALFERIPIYPRWYRTLRDYTSRYERRRIGYLWLRLPPHLRLLLNRHDEIFLLWADFVIMGSVMEEDISAERFEASYLERTLYER
ncbi:MAG: hypothetical protein U0694_27715 [Anaerolineae bacterium]